MTPHRPHRAPRAARLAATFVAIVGLLASAAVVPAAATPAAGMTGAGHSSSGSWGAGSKITYVALGDSYAYGLGAVHESESYPALLDDRRDVVLTADLSRVGATSAQVLSSLKYAKGALKNADLVTLTVGANDVDVAGLATACAPDPLGSACATALARASALLQPGSPLLPSLIQTISGVRNAAPDARIVVTGYPLLADPAFGLPQSPQLNALAQQLNAATLALNATIATAVAAVQATGGTVIYVDVVPQFAGHGIGSADPWIHFGNAVSYHATAAGYRFGYLAAITAAVDFGHLRHAAAA